VSFVGELLGVALHAVEPFVVDVLPEGGCVGVGLGGGADEQHDGCDTRGDFRNEAAEGEEASTGVELFSLDDGRPPAGRD